MALTEKKINHNEVASEMSQAIHNETVAKIYGDDGTLIVNVGHAHIEANSRLGMKLAKDGVTVLIPQPNDDPRDPLNWSWRKKHSILITLGVASTIGDFSSAACAQLILLQGEEWHLSPDSVLAANNLNVLFIGVFGLAAIPWLSCWGRAPVMFWTMVLTAAFNLGSALAPGFPVYYAMRALQGVFVGAGQTCCLAFIHDMFFFHELARKIGVWTLFYIAAPYFGPMFANFILASTNNWQDVLWLCFAGSCVSVLLMICFLDETWYQRDIPSEQQPRRTNRLLRLSGVWQACNHRYFLSIFTAHYRILMLALKPVIISVMVYYFTSFMWVIGINSTSAILFASPRDAGGYGFSARSVGYLFFTPVLAVGLGEVFGHFANDYVASRYIHRHKGVFVPEARLPPIYLAGCLMVPGLVLIGQSLQYHLTWVALAFGWGMYAFGTILSTVAITAYAVDVFPNAPGEVAGLINLARLTGGFSVGYFQLDWALRSGYAFTFGMQAVIVASGLVVVPMLHLFGHHIRRKSGPLKL